MAATTDRRPPRGRLRALAAAALLLIAMMMAGAAPCGAAEDGDTRRGEHEEKSSDWSGSVWIEEGFIDNLRASATNSDSAWFTTLEGQATWKHGRGGWLPHWLGGLVRGRIYGSYPERDFAWFGPSIGWEWKRTQLSIDYRYSPDVLRVDPEASANASAEVHTLVAGLRTRPGKDRRWTLLLDFQSDWEDYDPAYEARTHFEETIEAGARYRAHRMVQVRTAVAYAVRESKSENFDRDQVTAGVGLDFYLPADVKALIRYEHTWRNFLVGYPTDDTGHPNSNFGREDDVDAIETGFDLPVPGLDAASVQARYRFRYNGSTRIDREYGTNEGTLRLTYAFD